ncbi:MAG: AAA family ATPase, partial [Planctomycetes bacterium]|nr:AAA family ATPase [Planctomycetota bacterium]
MSRKSLLNETSEFYLKSGDYNGMPVSLLVERYGEMNVRDWLSELISEGLISVVFGDYHPNPHIKALPSEPESEQLGKLNTRLFQRACVYPNGKHLSEVIDHAAFAGRPFDFCLALGEPQLIHKSFDLSILEAYRNDPRYYYTCDDIHGQISVVDEFSRTDTMKASDQVFLETFGFSFDEAGHLHVAAFLRYLSKLSPEHQQVWSSKHVSGETYLHPDYYRTSIIGDWPERLSLYQAVLLEMKTINEICAAIGRAPLFKDDYAENRRPRAFGYLLRPTLKEYNDFIHLLDKMLSENISREFFKDDVSFESEEQR